MNLSAIRDAQGVYVKHILDSIELLKVVDIASGIKVCDVGTGWWFPLLPLAMSCPDVEFVGIDARRKKIDAINAMIEQLALTHCRAVWWRIEDHRYRYDMLTARAVAHVSKLIPWCMPLLKKGGTIVLYKEYTDEEKEELLLLCKKFSLALVQEHRYELFEGDIGRVIYVLK